MTVLIPFPLPPTGYAYNRDMRVNLQAIVDKLNEFNTGTSTWDNVYIGTPNSDTASIVLYNSSNTNYVTLEPAATTTNYTRKLAADLPANTDSIHLMLGTLDATGDIITDSWTTTEWLVPDSTGNEGILVKGNTSIAKIGSTAGRQFPIHDAGVTPAMVDFLGTANQITITNNASDVTFSLPQNIDGAADVGFGSVSAANGSLGSEAFKIGTGATQIGIYNDSGTFKFTVNGTLKTTIDGGGNIIGVGDLRGYSLDINNGSGAATINAGASGSWTLTLPVNGGTDGYVLKTNGFGSTSWVDVTSLFSGANDTLSNLGTVAINTTIASDSDGVDNCGSSTNQWNQVHGRALVVGKSGQQGNIDIYAPTAASGYISIAPADSAGNYKLTITNASQAAARTYTIPDAGTSADFVMSQGAATIAGIKTFSSFPVTPSTAPTTDYQVANKKYVDDNSGGGKVLQVVSATTTSATTTTSSSFQNTNAAVSITPSSTSNKILLLVHGLLTSFSNTTFAVLDIYNGSSYLSGQTYGFAACNAGAAGGIEETAAIVYEDSPNTTSAITYTVKIKSNGGGSVYFNRISGTATIIAMEIQG